MSFGFGVGDFVVAIELANKIRKEFVDAPSQFKAISNEVRSLSIVLQDANIDLSEQELDYQQKRDLHDIDECCRNVLDQLEQILDKYSELRSTSKNVSKRIKRVWKRLDWEPEVINELRSRISSNISLLNAFNGRLTRDNVALTRGNVVRLLQHQEDKERQDILNWLTPIDYAPQQSDFISRRQAGTGQWLLNSDEFQTWLGTDKQTLYSPGIPGAGKTICASIVIQYLLDKFRKDNTQVDATKGPTSIGIAYLYLNFRRQDEQRAEDLLASLLKQLAQDQSPLPESLNDLHSQCKEKQIRPSLEEISNVLHSIISTYSKVYFVVDALDECQVSDRSRFLSEISNLQTKTEANLFVTSRPILDIQREFKGCLLREILASDEDVERYLDGHMSQLPAFVLSRPKLQEEIKKQIIQAVAGMFLLAQLYLGSLEDKLTAKAIKNALSQFQKQKQMSGENKKPEILVQAYEQAMDRIMRQKAGFSELAKNVLSWITFAKRPLSTLELQHALAVEAGESEIDTDSLPQLEDMVSVCAGLVTVDEESNIIRLVHYTTQEYLERTQDDWFANAKTEIAMTCVTYLSFDAFETGLCPSDEEFEARLLLNALYAYTARYWGHHVQDILTETASAGVEQMAVDFLKSSAKISSSAQVIMSSKLSTWDSFYSQRLPLRLTGMHLAACLGLEGVMQTLLKKGHDPDPMDSYDLTPLSWAARNGHETVVKQLLAITGVKVNSKDILNGRTPLLWAVSGGHEAVIKLLLATAGIDVGSKDNNGDTPLSLAVMYGHEAVVNLLLAAGSVDVDLKDNTGQTPLSWAARDGNEASVRLLLATAGVNADSRDNNDRTPLSWAAVSRNEAVVKLLLATAKVDANSKDNIGQTPLIWAAVRGHEVVVKLLLATSSIDANSKNIFGETALSRAAARGHEAVVNLLLATSSVYTDSKSVYGETPLSRAAARGYDAVVKLLLATGRVDADSKDRSGETPLLWAAANGHEEVVKLLLATAKVDVNSTDKYGKTPLLWAADGGHEAVVRLLLANASVNVDSRNIYGQTPLSFATERGHKTIVKLLLTTVGTRERAPDGG